jgi:hypothetical protein
MLNKRVSSPGSRSPDPNQVPDSIAPVVHSALEYRRGFQDRIQYRDMVWAFYGNNQEILLAASITACGGKVLWKDARAMGVFLWLNSIESIVHTVHIMSVVSWLTTDYRNLKWRRSLETNICSAKNEIPQNAACFYFTLGKVRLVQGLWRHASWHPESNLVLKFLFNDFEQARWRTAALKTRLFCSARGEMVCLTGVQNQD